MDESTEQLHELIELRNLTADLNEASDKLNDLIREKEVSLNRIGVKCRASTPLPTADGLQLVWTKEKDWGLFIEYENGTGREMLRNSPRDIRLAALSVFPALVKALVGRSREMIRQIANAK